MKQLVVSFLWMSVLSASTLFASTYHVRPDGNNDNRGTRNTSAEAWRSIDRGQPTKLTKATVPGQKVIHVARAVQFPRRGFVMIAKKRIRYTGRTHTTLTGCVGVVVWKNNSVVKLAVGRVPKAGDTIIVHEGTYATQNGWPETTKTSNKVAVFISSKGTPKRPIVFKAKGDVVIDGRHLAHALRIDNAHHIVFDGFDIRRKCVFVWQSSSIKLLNNRIHEGSHGVSVAYSNNIEIAGNKLYDFHGAWTSSPLGLSTGSQYYVHHNTIFSSARVGINVGRKTFDCRIHKNVITHCRRGIEQKEESVLDKGSVKGNVLWNLGRVRWLAKIAKRKEGVDYYKGLKFTPQDIHEDPRIISFDPASPFFLDVVRKSPCVTRQGVIGAGRVHQHYPKTPALKNRNLIINAGFDSNWRGWNASAWHEYKPGQAGWGIVPSPTDQTNQCLEIYHYPVKDQIQPQVRSNFVTIDRGYPITISFRAMGFHSKDQTKTVTIEAGLLVPSWNNGSASAKESIKVSNAWKTYSVTLLPADYYPNRVAARFLVRSGGHVLIDDVFMSQHTNQKKKKKALRIYLTSDIPGTLVTDRQIPLTIENSKFIGRDIKVNYFFSTPNGIATPEKKLTFHVDKRGKKDISLPVPRSVTGATLLNVKTIEKGEVLNNSIYRFLVGSPVPRGKNSDFWGVNPRPRLRNPTAIDETIRKYRVAAMLGIGTWHHYLSIERMREASEEPWVEEMVDAARAAGIEWLWTLQNGKLFTGKRPFAPGPGNLGKMIDGQMVIDGLDTGRLTPEQFKIWEAWVVALAKKYKGKVKYWEICNEPNVYVNAEEYMKILRVTSPLIRKHAPKAIIIGGSLVNTYSKPIWDKTIAEGKPYYDQFSYHPYRFGLSNPFYGRFPKNLNLALTDLAKAGNPARIALTEEFRTFGPPLVDYSSATEKNEANNLARMYVRAMGEHVASYHHHHELFRDSSLAPNLGLTAIHTMASLLSNGDTIGKLESETDFVAYGFSIPAGSYPGKSLAGVQTESTVLALWRKEVNYATIKKFTLPSQWRGLKVFNLYGNTIPIKENTLTVGRDLVYIVLPGVVAKKNKTLFNTLFLNPR